MRKAAGEAPPPSSTLTGPASPRRSVCAPGGRALSFYRRPPSLFRGDLLMFSVKRLGWMVRRAWEGWAGPGHPSRRFPSTRRRRTFLTIEQLEQRDCPAVAIGDLITGTATLHSTDPNESGEAEPAVVTN